MRYDLTTLEVFVAIAEEKSLTKAAQRRHLAVSAVSKRIAELEDLVGSPLLVRYPRGVALTPAGQSTLRYAREIFATLQRMDDELGEYAAGVKGHVKIHATTAVLAQFLPADLGAFLQRYPQVKVDVEERVGAEIVRAVSSGVADIGIFSTRTPAPTLQTFEYKKDELVIAVPSGHPLALKQRISFADTFEYEFVGPHAESSINALMATASREAGLPVRQRVQVSSFDCMCRMVAAHIGIAMLPMGVLLPMMSLLDLQAVHLEDPWAQRSLVIGVRDFDALSLVSSTLIDHLTSAAG